MDLSKAIANFLDREGISQTALAKRVGVSQPTVSRVVKRLPVRRTSAYQRLFSYMQQYSAVQAVSGNPVMDAVRDTWDGSEEHADALARLILTSRELWPGLGKEKAP